MIYLRYEDILQLIGLHLPGISIRDAGLIQSALARPQSEYAGEHTYPEIASKAGALVQSLVTNHPLIDGNKRLGLISLIVFLSFNGYRLDATNDEAYDFIISIASSKLRDIESISEWIDKRLLAITP